MRSDQAANRVPSGCAAGSIAVCNIAAGHATPTAPCKSPDLPSSHHLTGRTRTDDNAVRTDPYEPPDKGLAGDIARGTTVRYETTALVGLPGIPDQTADRIVAVDPATGRATSNRAAVHKAHQTANIVGHQGGENRIDTAANDVTVGYSSLLHPANQGTDVHFSTYIRVDQRQVPDLGVGIGHHGEEASRQWRPVAVGIMEVRNAVAVPVEYAREGYGLTNKIELVRRVVSQINIRYELEVLVVVIRFVPEGVEMLSSTYQIRIVRLPRPPTVFLPPETRIV